VDSFFELQHPVTDVLTDGYGRLHPAAILYLVQETAGAHCKVLGVEDEKLGGLFWAVLRYRVEVDRLPNLGETVTVRTWPMPATKVAYPRAAEGYDAEGNRLFRLVSLWVLMDEKSRQMVLPGRSGVDVPGTTTGQELPIPAGLKSIPTEKITARLVTDREIDKNNHMNNTQYLDWAMFLLPREFEENHQLKAFTACYFNEARLGDELALCWTVREDNTLYLDSYRISGDEVDKGDRVFSTQMEFDVVM
jgi:acyl-ACP thioesterase